MITDDSWNNLAKDKIGTGTAGGAYFKHFIETFINNPYDIESYKKELLSICYDKQKSRLIINELNKGYGIFDDIEPRKKKSFFSDKPLNLSKRTIKEILREVEDQIIMSTDQKKEICSILSKEILSKDLRIQLWVNASGARARMLQNPYYYENLMNLFDDYPDYFLEIIELDLKRTFPEKSYDPHNPIIVKMRNILHSYAKRNPIIGYCQGLNFLIAKMLELIEDEEEVFWIMVALIEDILPIDFFSTMDGILVYQKILNDSIDIFFPEISNKFFELGNIDSCLFTLQWFVCLYTSTLKEPLYQLVWDMLFLEGPITLIKTGLAIIGLIKDKILEITDFRELFTNDFDQLQTIEQLFEVINHNLKSLDSPEELLKFMNSIFIDPKLFKIIQEAYYRMIAYEKEKEKHKQKGRLMNSPKINDYYGLRNKCKKNWPICIMQIDSYTKEKRKDNVFTFCVAEFPKPNPIYFSEEFKHTHYNDRSTKALKAFPLYKQIPNRKFGFLKTQFSDDSLELKNKMRIGRFEHRCKKPNENYETRIDKNLVTSPRLFESNNLTIANAKSLSPLITPSRKNQLIYSSLLANRADDLKYQNETYDHASETKPINPHLRDREKMKTFGSDSSFYSPTPINKSSNPYEQSTIINKTTNLHEVTFIQNFEEYENPSKGAILTKSALFDESKYDRRTYNKNQFINIPAVNEKKVVFPMATMKHLGQAPDKKSIEHALNSSTKKLGDSQKLLNNKLNMISIPTPAKDRNNNLKLTGNSTKKIQQT